MKTNTIVVVCGFLHFALSCAGALPTEPTIDLGAPIPTNGLFDGCSLLSVEKPTDVDPNWWITYTDGKNIVAISANYDDEELTYYHTGCIVFGEQKEDGMWRKHGVSFKTNFIPSSSLERTIAEKLISLDPSQKIPIQEIENLLRLQKPVKRIPPAFVFPMFQLLYDTGNSWISLGAQQYDENGSTDYFWCGYWHVHEYRQRPDLCVVLVDSLRPDHLGCYGYERDTSPAVDAFAAGAVRFDQAIASGSWTQPSIMSMMTSVPADVHQRVHWGRPHSTNVVTLAETLQKAGYQTVGLVANPMTNRKYGFARGFDFYDDYSLTGAPDATQGDIARQTAQGAKLTRLAKDWIEKRRDPEKPLFLFVLYIDVHWDYLPPPPFNRMFAPDPVPPPRDIWNLGRKSVPEAARRRSVAAYDGEIRYTDGCISNLLAAIDASPRGKDTVVVFCSDHGESFWERGVASHGNALFDEELRVPLVIRPARGNGDPAPPRVVSEQVGLIDLAPTLADLAGVPAPTNWVGRSLAPALRGETLPEIPIVLDNRIGDDGAILRGVRTSRWKVLAGPPHDRPTSLYDLLADPAETNDLLRAGDFALPPDVEAVVPLLKPTK